MYHKISTLLPIPVRVPEYLSTGTSTSMSIIILELTGTSKVRVPETQHSSITSTEYEYHNPAVDVRTWNSNYIPYYTYLPMP